MDQAVHPLTGASRLMTGHYTTMLKFKVPFRSREYKSRQVPWEGGTLRVWSCMVVASSSGMGAGSSYKQTPSAGCDRVQCSRLEYGRFAPPGSAPPSEPVSVGHKDAARCRAAAASRRGWAPGLTAHPAASVSARGAPRPCQMRPPPPAGSAG